MTERKVQRALRIGELAKRVGRSIHTIRWYEAQGLLPGVIRDAGGRRVYSERHVSWLDLVGRLRATGMSISQMREYASLIKQGRASIKQQRELLSEHRARVEQTILEWNEALKLLNRKLDFYGEWITTGERPREQPASSVARAPRGRTERVHK